MRTTLAIRTDHFEVARRRATAEGRNLGDVMDELMGRGLAASKTERPRILGTFEGLIAVREDFDDDLPFDART